MDEPPPPMPPARVSGPRRPGRPEVTTHGAIEQAAFKLFTEHGVPGTTLQMIADSVGISRRTLLRYYSSKYDIAWGQFDETLVRFRQLLAESPADCPISEAVHRAVVEFNRFEPDAQPPHRERMFLIMRTPALRAHSVLRHDRWRAVIADYVASRLGTNPDDLLPQLAGRVSLALALSAYDSWLANPDTDLLDLLDHAMSLLRAYLDCVGFSVVPSPTGHRREPFD